MRPCTVTWCSCIASRSADCVFGGVRLISSASTMFENTGPGTNTQVALSGVRVLLDDVGPGDVGRHQIGGELNPAVVEGQNPRERLDDERLGEPGNPGDDAVGAHEEADEHLLDRLLLADDHLADLAGEPVRRVAQRLGELAVGGIRPASASAAAPEAVSPGSAAGDGTALSAPSRNGSVNVQVLRGGSLAGGDGRRNQGVRISGSSRRSRSSRPA